MAYRELRPKHCTQDEWKRMIDYLSAQDMQAKKDYVAHYAELPRAMQGELGYLMSALKAAVQGCVSPMLDSYMENMISLHQIIHPIEFDGWAGEHNDLGPAYAFCADCFDQADPVLFYSDEFIAGDEAAARAFADMIAAHSAGIGEIAVAEVEMYSFAADEQHTNWAVCFQLKDDEKPRLAIPRDGEYCCVLGEVRGTDPVSGTVLVRHSYCMK